MSVFCGVGFCFGGLVVSVGCPSESSSCGGVFLSLGLCVPCDWVPCPVALFGVMFVPCVVSCDVPLNVLPVVIVVCMVFVGCLVAVWFAPPCELWFGGGWWFGLLVSPWSWGVLIFLMASTTSRTLANHGCVAANAWLRLWNSWLCGVGMLVVISDGRFSADPCHSFAYLFSSLTHVASCR